MPLYDYRCKDCGHLWEELVAAPGKISFKCPNCGGNAKRLLGAHNVRLSALRDSDTTCCGRTERCDSPPCSTGGTCRR